MRRAASRATMIGLMLAGGLLYAGISQAQDAGASAERDAELVAASGGPAPSAHLIPFEADKAAVEVRDDDVAPIRPSANAQAPTPDTRAEATPSRPVAVAEAAPANR